MQGIQKVGVIDLIDYAFAKFDNLMEENCLHICERQMKESLVYTQNTSVVCFFLLIQVPLA